MQEYFLVACSLADLVRRFRRHNADWSTLPAKVAIQLNDTHPSLAVPELMRILLDEAGLGWDQAWDVTRRTLAYTNHTLLPEALEKWPLRWFELMLPRHLEIILGINQRLLDEVRTRFPGEEDRVKRVSLVEEDGERKIRMANLAVVGSHSTNGVAAIHSRLLRTATMKDLADLFPERFNNKTNGITPRRWLLMANPALAGCITEAIGDGWITDLTELAMLKPFAGDTGFRDAVRQAKRQSKSRFTDWLKSTAGLDVDPDFHFRLPGQTHPRVQAAIAERAARRRPVQPAAREPASCNGAAHVLFLGQGGACLSIGKADHQVSQQPGRHDQRRPGDAGPPEGRFPARILRVACRAADTGDRRLQPDLDRRLRGERNQQHEVHDERSADHRHARWRHDRDGRSRRRGELLSVRAERGSSGGQPQLVQPAVALRQRAGDAQGARPDLLRPLQRQRAGHLRAVARHP